MTAVEVRDDPGHPEGGHVVIAFLALSIRPGPARLGIEILTEGARYDGPRDLDVVGEARSDGAIVYHVGDGVLDTMPTGTGVLIEIIGTGVAAETVWPELTLRKAGARRGGFRTGQPRRVEMPVEDKRRQVSPPGLIEAKRPSGTATGVGGETARPWHSDKSPGVTTTQPNQEATRSGTEDPRQTGTTNGLEEASGGTSSLNGATTDAVPAGHVRSERGTVPSESVRPRAAWPAKVTMAAAICIGAVGGWGSSVMLRPAPARVPTTISLPSPFADLRDLPPVSPNGGDARDGNWRTFLANAAAEHDTNEKAFWIRWAMRGMLKSDRADVAPVLTEYARQMAEGANGNQGVLAAAGLLWELAALAGDCGALTNLSKAYPGRDWRSLAEKCQHRQPFLTP